MSKTTHAIMEINKDLDSIGGLDGLVGDWMEILQHDIHNRVTLLKVMLDAIPEDKEFN